MTLAFNLLRNTVFIALALAFTACDKKNEPGPAPPSTDNTTRIVAENIAENTIWHSDTVYQLQGRIAVLSGATLTIEPGTIIKAESGSGSNSSALLITRGAKIMAEGTLDLPIIFTSIADDLTPTDLQQGNSKGSTLDANSSGLWGGLIILGHAPVSTATVNENNICEAQIEGIPTSDPTGLYGGTNPADDSGILRYISIRHGGTNIGAGNEINGLTLGGVGAGTQIDHIEVVANQDDGIEWFGGNVNVSNALVLNAGDDGLDTDQSWSGTLNNFIVIAPTGHCLELDGAEGDMEATHILEYGTVAATEFAGGSALRIADELVNLDENTQAEIRFVHFTALYSGQLLNQTPAVTFEGITLNTTPDSLPDFINGPVPAGVSAGDGTGADAQNFTWTWSYQSGYLSNL